MEVDTLHYLLLVASSRSNQAMMARTREYGLMPGQPKVLEYVAENEGRLQRDIARACATDRATITGVLGRMEEAGLVTRTPKEGDRRALEVRLTGAGWLEAEHVAHCGAEVDEIACAGMTAEERDELAALLGRVIKNFEAERDQERKGNG